MGAPGWEDEMDQDQQWNAPAELDRISVVVDTNRADPAAGVTLRMSGHSTKKLHPLWTWTVSEEDPRNVESVVGGVLGAVMFYRPTSPDKFLRACVGGALSEDPQLPFE